MSKHRPRTHEYDDKGKGELFKKLSEFAVINELQDNDYGIDFAASLSKNIDDQEVSKVTTNDFYIQLKSSGQSPDDLRTNGKVVWSLDVDDILFLHQRQIPSFLMIYEVETEQLYWTVLQEYVWDILDQDSRKWRQQKTKRVEIDQQQTVEKDGIKDAVHNIQRRIVLRRTLEFNQYTLLQSAFWTGKSVLEQEDLEPFDEVIESQRNKAKPIVKRLNELRGKEDIDGAELLKLIEQSVKIKDKLERTLLGEPNLTYREQNPWGSKHNCPRCGGSLSRLWKDSDEVSCKMCSWQGYEIDL